MIQKIVITPVVAIPLIKPGDDISSIIIDSIQKNGITLKKHDIVCVASKIISISENKYVDLKNITATPQAESLHKTVPRKDPRVIQLIIDQAGRAKENINITGSWIGAKNHIGRVLTSAGIDKIDENTVLTLPDNPDYSASKIGEKIKSELNKSVGVLITDSDGREGINGATQLCIGLYGVPPIRKKDDSPETACDMLAAAAGLVMGQRGNNIPVVVISGYKYTFNSSVRLKDAY